MSDPTESEINDAIDALQKAINQPMSPREARIIHWFEQAKATLRDDPDLEQVLREEIVGDSVDLITEDRT